MYLYEGYCDPIQMISGDAYAALRAIPIVPLQSKEELKPKIKYKISPKKELEKAIKQHLLTESVKYIAQMFGIYPENVRYQAKKMGYRALSNRKEGCWEAPETQERF